jgi:hypothetical protein
VFFEGIKPEVPDLPSMDEELSMWMNASTFAHVTEQKHGIACISQ